MKKGRELSIVIWYSNKNQTMQKLLFNYEVNYTNKNKSRLYTIVKKHVTYIHYSG